MAKTPTLATVVRDFTTALGNIGKSTDKARLLVWSAHSLSNERGDKLIAILFKGGEPADGFKRANVNRIIQAGEALVKNGDDVTAETLAVSIKGIEDAYKAKAKARREATHAEVADAAEGEGEGNGVPVAVEPAVVLLKATRAIRSVVAGMGVEALPILAEAMGDAQLAQTLFDTIVKSNTRSAARATVNA